MYNLELEMHCSGSIWIQGVNMIQEIFIWDVQSYMEINGLQTNGSNGWIKCGPILVWLTEDKGSQ